MCFSVSWGEEEWEEKVVEIFIHCSPRCSRDSPLLVMTAFMLFLSFILFHLPTTFPFLLLPPSSAFAIPRASNDDAAEFLKAAEKLRADAASLESDKSIAIAAAQADRDAAAAADAAYREKWSVTLPILKQDGRTVNEGVAFKPLLSNGTASTLIRAEIPLPMGMILGESVVEGVYGKNITVTTVDEVNDNSQAVGLLQPGDVLRCTTATQVQMTTPTWQLLVGGIGQPKTVRFMYACDGSRSSFEEVMGAIKSNSQDPEGRPAIIVVERKDDEVIG